MEQRSVGQTDLKIPSVGLGAAPLGNMFTDVEMRDARETVRAAYDMGVRFFDTAPIYGHGESERKLSQILPDFDRSTYVISSKVGYLIDADGKEVRDFTRDGVLRSIEESLERLQIDALDIVHIHDPDDHEDGFRKARDMAFPALAELREQGVIKAIGAGMNQWEMLVDFANAADFNCFLLAGRYSLLEQGALDEFFPLCQEKGISVLLGGVYNSGILATGAVPGAKYNYFDAPPEIMDKVHAIEAVCSTYTVPLRVAAVRFAMAAPAVTSLILGARNASEVKSIEEALTTDIPEQLWADLKSKGLLRSDAPTGA
ncbi:MAG: aldo/keto reductase [Chloroflexi bacterium]|nr:aldo/keto reductase [Chloroflexota bacterium]